MICAEFFFSQTANTTNATTHAPMPSTTVTPATTTRTPGNGFISIAEA